MCFIDASKAFDYVNHENLFYELCNSIALFHVSNGVRQGSILSPFLFNAYRDDLSMLFNNCRTGCRVGNSIISHLMYDDDLVILCPYSAGPHEMLQVCSQYGSDFDIQYNAKKISGT